MDSLEHAIRDVAAGFSGTMTLALRSPGGETRIDIDAERSVPTASVIKLPILVALHRAAAAGLLSFDDRLQFGAQHDVFGSGVLHQLTHGVEMSLRDAATLMIIISDNVATNMCLEAVGGFENVNETMRTLGLEHTTMFMRLGDTHRGLDGRNHYVTSADDIARLLAMLARREVVSPDASDQTLRLLRRQQKRDKLSRELPWNELNMLPDPRNNWVAEKGGTYIGGVRNDAALMHGLGGQVAIAAFCNGGDDASGREACDALGRIGRLAWDACCADPLSPAL